MEKQLGFLKNIAKVIGILVFFMGIALLIEQYFVADALVPAIMALAVFVISYVTDGFLYGIIASMLSVLALNFAFAFPYFAFNFNIPENIISAVVMLAITIMTSTLTAQLKMQEKVRIESEKEKMRGNLLRAVSHDLRTPLTSISGSSAAIVDNYEQLSKEQVLQLCRGIREDSQWLIGMVENILSITRIDNEGVKLKKTPVVLEELIGQVIFNIMENAVQHALGMTEITLHVFILGNKAVFEIMDDGCGIEKERLKSIFKDYFEIRETPVDNQKRSMGIGLAVCASIIRAHDGVITAENRKGGGCCFRFTLDMEETE
ncbi:MAG: DUF4118 domain-containing protein [Roseburia inulinivorans]|nr:DUF4118 domain-containing protein [Roseburia inulinivorans]